MTENSNNANTVRDLEAKLYQAHTIRTAIDYLRSMPSDTLVAGIEHPHSARADYKQLAVTQSYTLMLASHVAGILEDCIGNWYHGYKGGDYLMDEDCMVYVAEYGESGVCLAGWEDAVTKEGAKYKRMITIDIYWTRAQTLI